MAYERERQVRGHERLAVRRQLPQKTDPDTGRPDVDVLVQPRDGALGLATNGRLERPREFAAAVPENDVERTAPFFHAGH